MTRYAVEQDEGAGKRRICALYGLELLIYRADVIKSCYG